MLPSAFVAPSTDDGVFSSPYLRLSAAIYVRHGSPGFGKLDALDRRTVTVVADNIWPNLLAAKGCKAEITTVADISAALRTPQTGAAHAFTADPNTPPAPPDPLNILAPPHTRSPPASGGA